MTDAAVILAVCGVVGAIYYLTDGGMSDITVVGSGASSGASVAPQSPSVGRNFASVVAQAKAQLEMEGEDLSGPCGAFKITRLSAQMIGGDCGVLDKPSGNNCDGFAVDIHVYRDGFHYDVLSDGGGANGPTYSLIGPVDVSRWRQP